MHGANLEAYLARGRREGAPGRPAVRVHSPLPQSLQSSPWHPAGGGGGAVTIGLTGRAVARCTPRSPGRTRPPPARPCWRGRAASPDHVTGTSELLLMGARSWRLVSAQCWRVPWSWSGPDGLVSWTNGRPAPRVAACGIGRSSRRWSTGNASDVSDPDRPLGPEPHGRTCRLSTGVPAACRAAIGSTRDLAAGRTQRPDRRTRPVAPATAHSSPNKAPDRNLVLGVPGGHIKPAARHWVWQRRHGAATRLRPHAVRDA